MTDGVCRLKHTSLRHQTLHLVSWDNVALLQRLYCKILSRQLVLSQQHLYTSDMKMLSATMQRIRLLSHAHIHNQFLCLTALLIQSIITIMMRSDQPKPPAVAIVRQNGLSSASSRASVADTPMSRQIWWTQVVDGRPQVCLHSCEGRSPSLVLAQIRGIEFAGTSLPERWYKNLVWLNNC